LKLRGQARETSLNDDERSHLTLFDTGVTQFLVFGAQCQSDADTNERIERVITSHWHGDHTGGLLSFLEL
jgi:metal-dependent hydrolase (beta-lactamase superfamily II)